MLSFRRLVLLSALALAACSANPPEAEAGQDEAVTEPAALAAQAETTSATPDPAIAEDDAPLRATPPPPGPNLPDPDQNGIITINWDDLLPEGEMERIEELYAYSSNH